MARDDDIFRKLKKETPIVKRKEIKPLSSRDFSGKSAFDFKLGKQAKSTPRQKASDADIEVFSRSSQTAKSSSPKPSMSRTSRQQAPALRKELEIFGEPSQEQSVKAAQKAPAPRTAAAKRSGNEFSGRAPVRAKAELDVLPGAKRSVHARLSENQPRRFEPAHNMAEPVMSEVLRQEPLKGTLAFRHELKYYINYCDYMLLRNALKALLPLDRFAGPDGNYLIRSLYFDDEYETAVADKVNGYDFRQKYRIRIYDYSDGTIKFEKKIKRGQYIAKQSIRIDRYECDALIAGDFSVLEGRSEPLAQEIYIQMKNNNLRPRVIVDYLREAYVYPVENVRITFDKDLKAGLLHDDIFDAHVPTMPMLDSGLMVLEVKFNKFLPPHIKGVLNCIGAADRCAISKYVLCRRHD